MGILVPDPTLYPASWVYPGMPWPLGSAGTEELDFVLADATVRFRHVDNAVDFSQRDVVAKFRHTQNGVAFHLIEVGVTVSYEG